MRSCHRAAVVFSLAALLFGAFAACNKSTASADERPRIPIRADDKGFTPSSVTVKKGTPATLVFTRTTDDTCAKEVVFPEIPLKKALPLNVPVDVDVPTGGEARTLVFTCGMGMFKSSVVITP